MGPDFVELESSKAFAETLKGVEAAIAAHGMAVFARIDHAQAAKAVGLSMPPTVVLLYGNPKGGTPMMLANPRAALDLPLRVLVREEGARVLVSFHPVADMLVRAGVPADLAAKLEPAQQVIADWLKT
ncbi:MAG TPA: DUF302 domain-containing protein [Rhizomicrobium sp.]|nr:DUF302 domain-containing protein [Rhizomicrobium sp.]